jgi:hypothetical protein
MGISSVIRPICSDAADVVIGWDLIKQFRQHRRIANIPGGDLDCLNLQCFLVNPNVYLASGVMNLSPNRGSSAILHRVHNSLKRLAKHLTLSSLSGV